MTAKVTVLLGPAVPVTTAPAWLVAIVFVGAEVTPRADTAVADRVVVALPVLAGRSTVKANDPVVADGVVVVEPISVLTPPTTL